MSYTGKKRIIDIKDENTDEILYSGNHISYKEAYQSYLKSENYKVGLDIYIRNRCHTQLKKKKEKKS